MKKNFEDILNEKIRKQQSFEYSNSHKAEATAKTENTVSYSLLFHLQKNLNLEMKTIGNYKLSPQRNKESIKENLPKEDYGYFSWDQDTIFAKIFFKNHGEEIKDGMSLEMLKKSFRKLAFKLHPDSTGGSAKAFIELRDYHLTLKEAWQAFDEAS